MSQFFSIHHIVFALSITFLTLLLNIVHPNDAVYLMNPNEVCIYVAETIMPIMRKSSGSNFGGGNSEWEERNLGSYKTSETRFHDIMDELCSNDDIKERRSYCLTFIEQHEDVMQDWFLKQYAANPKGADFFNEICVTKLKLGCPPLKFGPDCADCAHLMNMSAFKRVERESIPSFMAACQGHGTCSGNMTRLGNGQCKCESGMYAGEDCGECSAGYYRQPVYHPDGGGVLLKFPFFTCEQCAENCGSAGCAGMGTNRECLNCAKGYTTHKNDGVLATRKLHNGSEVTIVSCMDIDECALAAAKRPRNLTEPCGPGKYCDNRPGKHLCWQCHKACADTCEEGEETPSLCLGGCSAGFEPLANQSSHSPESETTEEGKSAVNKGCQDVDECRVAEAAGRPLCKEARTFCRNTEGSYECATCNAACGPAGCVGGGNASHCVGECAAGYIKASDGQGCVDIDECAVKDKGASAKCAADHRCVNLPGSFTCECAKEFCPKDEADAATCKRCEAVAKRFAEGLRNTSSEGFGGGNTAWESRKLGDYEWSETRLISINEKVCDDKDLACQLFFEAREADIEHWWFSKFKASPKSADFFQDLCVDRWRLCCSSLHFGPQCNRCSHVFEFPIVLRAGTPHAENLTQLVGCSGRGKCDGDGTRLGSGKCQCNPGYAAEDCSQCASNYYREAVSPETQNERRKLVFQPQFACKECDAACGDKGCRQGSTALHCVNCAKGYAPSAESKGSGKSGNSGNTVTCEDVDECASVSSSNATQLCPAGQYCLNAKGSYDCVACHPACATSCSGPAAADCREKCASGYEPELDEQEQHGGAIGGCRDIDECENPNVCSAEHEECINEPGSFKCECAEGFRRDESGVCVQEAAGKDEL